MLNIIWKGLVINMKIKKGTKNLNINKDYYKQKFHLPYTSGKHKKFMFHDCK